VFDAHEQQQNICRFGRFFFPANQWIKSQFFKRTGFLAN
jgi:hypothetical protein